MSLSRRGFLEKMGWGAMVVAAGALVAAMARFIEPNVTTPGSGPVEIGLPDEYPAGSLTFVENARVYLGRDERGIYAMAAICTHLGCTPHLEADAFVCPCHASRFNREGQVLTGPAVRALERAFVERGANGRLIVDRSRVVDNHYRLPV